MNFKFTKSSSQIKTLLGLITLSLMLFFQNCSKAHLTSEGGSGTVDASSSHSEDDTGATPTPTPTPKPTPTPTPKPTPTPVPTSTPTPTPVPTPTPTPVPTPTPTPVPTPTPTPVPTPTPTPVPTPTPTPTPTAADPCSGTPAPGTTCKGGAIYIGSLSPGATSGTGTNKYMTTPGGCDDIPSALLDDTFGPDAYPSAEFTPSCSGGIDFLTKYWNNGSSTDYNIPTIIDVTGTGATGMGATFTDPDYGSTNTINIVAITDSLSGGYHAAARYCSGLVYGGYKDWYLPNRYELNLMYTNKASIPGLETDPTGGVYWSSTEFSAAGAWRQRFSDGYQGATFKYHDFLVRCVRKY